ncbi:hypothetical protein, partial [Erythrobacter sp. HI0063]|uniref:hypothetical protein n=1 Tax=Erythrobacter sp. HI0063 TaxID=1822240 RepID=UPI000AD429F2
DEILRERLSLEELSSSIQSYAGHKQDGDWLKQIAAAKSAVVSLAPYPAFNRAIASFRFFAERAATRPQHREPALRGAFLSAALASMALDAALERLVFEEPKARYDLLYSGVTYGDAGDNRVQSSIDTVLSVISQGVKNGRALARQTGDALEEMFTGVRAEIIAEFFAKEQNAAYLYPVARELEGRAHARSRDGLVGLSVEAKSIIGVFADFVGAKRTALLSSEFVTAASAPSPTKAKAKAVVGLPMPAPSAIEAQGPIDGTAAEESDRDAPRHAGTSDAPPKQEDEDENPSPNLL